MSKKTLKMADGGSLSQMLRLPPGVGGTGGGYSVGGGGGGSAYDGLGQVGEGSKTISSALNRAQASNADAANAAMSSNSAIGVIGISMPTIGSTIGNPTPIATQEPTQPSEIPESIVSPMKKGGEVKKSQGGKINLGNCRVNTVAKNKASPNW